MSNVQVKGGRLPIAAKKTPGSGFRRKFGDRLGVDVDLHNEITAKGLEYRWIDAKKLYNNQGYHENGWEAYKRTGAPTSDFKNGNDPDGIIRRGGSILGVREKTLGDEHRAYLQERATNQVGKDRNAAQRRAADELRKMAGKTGIKISEGDDEEDGEAE